MTRYIRIGELKMAMVTQPEPPKPKKTRKPKSEPLPVQVEETPTLSPSTQDLVNSFDDPIA